MDNDNFPRIWQKNNKYLLGTWYLHKVLSHLILIIALVTDSIIYLHFTDEEPEVGILMNLPRVQSYDLLSRV